MAVDGQSHGPLSDSRVALHNEGATRPREGQVEPAVTAVDGFVPCQKRISLSGVEADAADTRRAAAGSAGGPRRIIW